MSYIRAIINDDGSGVIEGQPGVATQTLPGGLVLTAQLPEGWRLDAEMSRAGWRGKNFDVRSLGAVPAGQAPTYSIAGRALVRTLGMSAPPLTAPQLKSFVRRAGLGSVYSAAIAAAGASPEEAMRFAADSLASGTEFRFAETMAAAAAVLSTLPPIPGAPDFASPAVQGALLAHWTAAAAQELPGVDLA